MAEQRKTKMTEDQKQRIAASEGFPIEKVEEFVAWMGDRPYITGAGLQWKMLETYGAGKFAIQSTIPCEQEYTLLCRMMGLADNDPLVVVKGEVWVEGFERPFTDFGTASPKNLKGFVKFSDYPLEMAVRRATNRAMRLATATGLCSVDEIDTDAPLQIAGSEQSDPPASTRKPAPPQGQPQKQAQPAQQQAVDPDAPIGQENAQKLIAYAKEHGWAIPHLYNAATKHYGKKLSELTRDEAKSLQAHMREAYAAKNAEPPQDEQEPPPIGNGPEGQPDAFSGLEGSGDPPIGEEGYGELRMTAKDADIEEAALIAQIRTLLVEKLLMKKKDAASFNVHYMPESLVKDIVEWINDQAKS